MYPKPEWKESGQELNESFPKSPKPSNISQANSNHKVIKPQYLKPQLNIHQPPVCERLAEYNGLSKIIRSVLDISETVSKIMNICSISQCKCEHAIDLIIYAFLHFDEYGRTRQCGHSRKKICKDEFQYELRRQCNFTNDEAKLAYSIIKYPFHAFYFKQAIPRFDELIFDEMSWKIVIHKTIIAYKNILHSDKSTFATVTANIKATYQDYIDKRLKKLRISNNFK